MTYNRIKENESSTISSITLSISAAFLLAIGGAIWIYTDATKGAMDTADMWAVGFFVGFFILPVLGGILVLLY